MEHVDDIIGASGAFVAALASLAAVALSVWKWRTECIRRKQAENEIIFNRAALGFPDFVHEWDNIGHDLVALINETEVDRVLILRAWNGRLEPRWTTAVYQMREGDQAPIAYVHFELDDDYVRRIREIAQQGSTYFRVDDLPECAIRNVYHAEGVVASYWSYINSVETSDGQSTAIAYASFSTHDPDGLSEETQTKCRIVTGRLKGLAHQFDMNSQLKRP